MMNPYQRGHTWNPYNCGSGGGGGLPGSSGLTGGPGGGGGGGFLPNRIATLSDVRYRSFQAPAQISSRVAKSRTSLALPPNSNFVHGGGVASSGVGVGAGLGPASSRFFGGSSHQLAHFHEHHHPNEIMRWVKFQVYYLASDSKKKKFSDRPIVGLFCIVILKILFEIKTNDPKGHGKGWLENNWRYSNIK